jgi:hypothetical protein
VLRGVLGITRRAGRKTGEWSVRVRDRLIPLTREACGLSYRPLCDVTARGKKTLEKALSVAQLGLHENWNHGQADDPHVGSIMMAPELLPFVVVELGFR